MAGEDLSEPSSASDDSLEGWLDTKAEELEMSRQELLARLQDGYSPDGANGNLHVLRQEFIEQLGVTEEEFETELADLESELGDVRSDVDSVEQTFEEKIEDVRERVVQVKRETDAKASADHDHPDLAPADHDHPNLALADHDHSELAPADHDHPNLAPADHDHPDLRERTESVAGQADQLAKELQDISATVEELDREDTTEFDEKIEDVRERVIQVKREADAKAPADHDHPDLHEHTESVADQTDQLAEELQDISATVEKLDQTVTDLGEEVETGFENYEDVLEYLTDATDDLESKLTTLAEVTVSLRDQTQTLAARHAARAAADELAHLANRRGVESAKCSHCGETVHIGLLAEPKCPHCASTFNDVEPKQGFFGSARLLVGDPPALEGERADWDVESALDPDAASTSTDLDDIIEEDNE